MGPKATTIEINSNSMPNLTNELHDFAIGFDVEIGDELDNEFHVEWNASECLIKWDTLCFHTAVVPTLLHNRTSKWAQ